jgi:hypothetical protein
VLQTNRVMDAVSCTIIFFTTAPGLIFYGIREDDQKLMSLTIQFAKNRDKWAIINEYFPERDRQQLKGRHKRLLNEAAGVYFLLSIYLQTKLMAFVDYRSKILCLARGKSPCGLRTKEELHQ